GHNHRAIAGLNGLGGEADRFQSRAANLVDRHGTNFGRQAREDGGLARGVLAEAGSDDVAHDAFIDLRGIELGALDHLANDDRAKLCGAEIRQATLEFPYRSAASGKNYDFVESSHRYLLRAFHSHYRSITFDVSSCERVLRCVFQPRNMHGFSHSTRKHARRFLNIFEPTTRTLCFSHLRTGIGSSSAHHFSLDFEFYSLYTINQSQQMTVA